MKDFLCFLISCLVLTSMVAQKNSSKLFEKMSDTYDQFGDRFDPGSVDDQLTIVYIPGNNDPFGRIYDKHKGKKIAEDVQFIGGFREIMIGMPADKKRAHLQEAFVSRYGKDHFTILLDLDSEIARMLSIQGYTILTISRKDDKIIRLEDFGFDRIAFFKVLNTYLT